MSESIFNKAKVDKKKSKILKALDNCNSFEIETILDEVKKDLIIFP
ncbi:hypothetical protein SAMN05216273_11884 [Chryseobacterium taihuense]|uniref:Uncharacterized protein n=1 Tax=Chryseobacterium taihuense TaxID=1141221 RepID=A0ABY0R172_9FLAO|nr:hypothetical protein SAMN05216273_11884 [Chryseobacterium taihuense]